MSYKAIKTRIKLDKDQTRFLLLLMRSAKNLYNQALYNVRQHFFDTGEFLTYNENYHLLKTSENYKMLNSSLGQTVIKKVDEAMKAFFGSIKSTNTIKVILPRYLDKLGYYALIDRMVYKPQNGYYTLPRGNFIKRVSKYYKKHTFSGRRTKRGLYVSKEGKIINADLNAALNIFKKGNSNTERLGYSGVNTPKRTYLFG